jgi:hypothetical protein
MGKAGHPDRRGCAGIIPARTEITEELATRPSDRLVCTAEVTEGMAGPGDTTPAAAMYRMECPAEAELDRSVLQRWRQLFYHCGDEGV